MASAKTRMETSMNKKKPQFENEMYVEIISALGLSLGEMLMPIAMREGLIRAYMDSGTVKHSYLYINGEEITDGKNHNPFRGVK